MKFETIRYVADASICNPLVGSGVILNVESNGKAFNIEIFVQQGILRAAYFQVTEDQITHFNKTLFTFDATGDIINLLDTSTWETYVCSVVLSESPNVDIQFENVILTLHIYPSGGVGVKTVLEPRSGLFSQ